VKEITVQTRMDETTHNQLLDLVKWMDLENKPSTVRKLIRDKHRQLKRKHKKEK